MESKGKIVQLCTRGQGTLEYILFLIITIILVLGIFYQFSRGFRTYAEALFGGYFACLIETGELPGQSAECASELKNLDSKSEKALVKGNFGNRTPVARTPANASSSGGGGGSGAVEPNVFGGRSRAIGRVGGDGRPSVVSEGKSDTDFGKNKNSLLLSNVPIGHARGNSGRQESITMRLEEDDTGSKKKDKARPRAAAAGKAAGDGDALRPVKSSESSKEARRYNAPSETGTFSIGALIRMLIMILIIVAMIVFFGGQLLQISKSREKGGD